MKQICCLILLMLSTLSIAQCDKYYGEVLDVTRDSLNKEVLKRFRCSGIEKPRHIKVYDVFLATYDGFTCKSDFCRGHFKDNMCIERCPSSTRLMNLEATVLICDESGNEIVKFDGYQFYYANGQYLSSEMMRLGIKDVYVLLNVCGYNSTFFGTDKSDETYVIIEDKCQTFRVQDCPDEVWEKVFINPNNPSFEINQPKLKMPMEVLEK